MFQLYNQRKGCIWYTRIMMTRYREISSLVSQNMLVLSGPLALTRRDIEKLEWVQRQSARFIIGDFSCFGIQWYYNVLTDLNIPSLEHRRQLSSIILLSTISLNLFYRLAFYYLYHQRTLSGISSSRNSQYSNSSVLPSDSVWNSLPAPLS